MSSEPTASEPAVGDFSATSRLGLLLAVVGASSYGVMISITRLAYDEGTNPVTLICARALVPSLIITAIILARRASFALVPGAFWPVVGISLGQLGITIGYLSAVAYIPVSLAALVFYAHPVLVAALLGLFGRSRVGWIAAPAFAAAFAGLGLALAPSFSVLEPLGLGLAFCATLSGTLLLLSADRLPARQGVLPVGLYMNLVALAVAAPYALASDSLAAPQSPLGWSALAIVCLGFIIAFFSVVGAVRFGGALRTALIFNLEPVIAILSAMLLLGESLSALQGAGVALVFAALTLATLAEKQHPPLPPAA